MNPSMIVSCTHHKCMFCTIYNDLPFSFKMSPLEDVEADLKETKKHYGFVRSHVPMRTFLTGANPFVLQAERLLTICWLNKIKRFEKEYCRGQYSFFIYFLIVKPNSSQ